MSIAFEKQAAYVLHTRNYRETSLLVDLFVQDHGRVSTVAKGVRRAKASQKGLLQPFTPLFVTVVGKRELKTLTHVEANGIAHALSRVTLFCGLYMNELLMRVLHVGEPTPKIYALYVQTLQTFVNNDRDYEANLRLFERDLLQHLGYGLPLSQDAHSGGDICPEQHYYFEYDKGFIPCARYDMNLQVFRGRSLLALASGQLTDREILLDCKRLLRYALLPLLGNRPLKSRELFMQC